MPRLLESRSAGKGMETVLCDVLICDNEMGCISGEPVFVYAVITN